MGAFRALRRPCRPPGVRCRADRPAAMRLRRRGPGQRRDDVAAAAISGH